VRTKSQQNGGEDYNSQIDAEPDNIKTEVESLPPPEEDVHEEIFKIDLESG